ncbi:MAG: hypothetical protein DRP62_05210 [Planctomycetota bacterium]|nr:MAG: hypothetical protein DRP62_05210 [Planctomycetota bacterium]
MEKKSAIEGIVFTRKGGKWEVKYTSSASVPFCHIFGDYMSCEECGYWKNGKCIIKPDEISFEEMIYRVMVNAKKRDCITVTIEWKNKDIKRGFKAKF